MPKHATAKACFLNASRVDFDRRVRFDPIEGIVDLVRADVAHADRIVELAQSAEILISKETPLHAAVIDRLPSNVHLICEAGTGFDNIDLRSTGARGITVCNVPAYSTVSVAQLTIGLMIALSTGMHRLLRSVAFSDLTDFQHYVRPMHMELQGKTLGVIGAGTIGQEVIRLARALGMLVSAFNPSPRHWLDKGITQRGLQDVFAESDFISLHCPYIEASENSTKMPTRHLINAETIACMKRRPFLINAARGGLVNHDDLVRALVSGKISGAALDVQDPEPLPPGHALWSMENVIITPHIGWKSLEARRRLVQELARNISAFLNGTPINVVRAP